MFLTKDTSCKVCKKVFCCENCRNKHEVNKHDHREVKCALCVTNNVQIKNFNDPTLLCHIVLNHLPLQCRLCGQLFKNAFDLTEFSKCNWREQIKIQKRHTGHEKSSLQVLLTPSPITRNLDLHSKLKRSVSDGSSDFVCISPAALTRNTSTPVQNTFANQKPSDVWNNMSFSMQSPEIPPDYEKINSATSPKQNNTRGVMTDVKNNVDTQYYSHLHLTQFENKAQCMSSTMNDKSVWESYKNDFSDKFNKTGYSDDVAETRELKSVAKQTAETQPKVNNVNEQTDDQNQAITKSLEGLIKSREFKQHKDSSKKVRFSDEYLQTNPSSVEDDEVFFEAKEEFLNSSTVFQVQEKSECNVCRQNDDDLIIEQLTNKMTNKDKENNASNQKNVHVHHQNAQESTVISTREQSRSSRVLMMLIVEKNGACFTSSELKPIINSGLKRLEENATAEKIRTNMVSVTPQSSERLHNQRKIVTSVDSYVRISSTECRSSCTPNKREYKPNESSKVEGLLSSMARSVMNAFKKLPGSSSSKYMSREPVSPALAATRTDDKPTVAKESEARSKISKSDLSTSLMLRPYKRPRDGDTALPSVDSFNWSASPTSESDTVLSPAAKRYRGSWVKIKARQPIARMRRSASVSRLGICSQTQRFQQGSLSVQDKMFPMPSRAYQNTKSTQTE